MCMSSHGHQQAYINFFFFLLCRDKSLTNSLILSSHMPIKLQMGWKKQLKSKSMLPMPQLMLELTLGSKLDLSLSAEESLKNHTLLLILLWYALSVLTSKLSVLRTKLQISHSYSLFFYYISCLVSKSFWIGHVLERTSSLTYFWSNMLPFPPLSPLSPSYP